MKVYFIRHGQSNYNVKNLCNDNPKKRVYLTALGKKQAENARERLKNENIGVIYISKLPRTKQTAHIINESHKIPIKVDARINERKTGFEGKSCFEYKKAMEKDPFYTRANGGESFLDEKKRVFSFIKFLIKKKYNIAVVIAHEETVKIATGYFRKLSDREIWEMKVENGQMMEFEV